MQNHELEQVIKNADRAINNEDFDHLMEFYSEDAILVVKPNIRKGERGNSSGIHCYR